ncbi:MAG: pyridoxamine 5'-phosphate oxidase family protein [Pseudolabrys sp.]|nr:pyridoxamine 5'-phosphate oxidase family protein [Pseudolabrys sp.]
MADNELDRVWELMETISFCMLATWTGQELRSRPMDGRIRRKENAVYMLTDVRHYKDDEIARYPKVMLAFADKDAMKFVSLSGKAQISNDRAKIKELWEPTAKAWWDSADNPNIRVITVIPESAEYWDSPGKLVSMVKMVTAAATGTKPDLGDNKKVAMS